MKKISQEELFIQALYNMRISKNPIEFLDLLITDFGLDVNWRREKRYDTLLFEALKQDKMFKKGVAEFLVSKGASVNARCGMSDECKSIYDAAQYWSEEVKTFLLDRGAISYENCSGNIRNNLVNCNDISHVARTDRFILRTESQLDLSAKNAHPDIYKEVRTFVDKNFVEADIQRTLR